MRYTTLICPRKDGSTVYTEEALQDLATTAVGKDVRSKVGGPIIGRVIRSWVDSKGVHTEVELCAAEGKNP